MDDGDIGLPFRVDRQERLKANPHAPVLACPSDGWKSRSCRYRFAPVANDFPIGLGFLGPISRIIEYLTEFPSSTALNCCGSYALELEKVSISIERLEMYLSNEGLLVILLVGLVAGWLAGQIVQGAGFGLIGDMVVGVIGAFVGDWLVPRLGLHLGFGLVGAIINATIGAIVLLVLIRLLRGGGRWGGRW